MNTLPPISAVSFDFWQTLASSNPEYAKARLALFEKCSDFSSQMVKSVVNSFKKELDDMAEKEGVCPSTEFCVEQLLYHLTPAFVSSGFAHRVTDELQDIAIEHPPVILPETVEMLKMLKQKDFKIGLISNTNFIKGKTLRKIFAGHGIEFDLALFSDEFGFAKPNPWLFTHFCQNITCKPENIIHIGDNPVNDVQGANACGFQSLLVNNPSHTVQSINTLFV